VRFDHVDGALEPGVDEEGEPGRMLHDLIVGIGLVGQLEAHAPPVPDDPHAGIWVEPAGRRVGTRQDLDRPLREGKHLGSLGAVPYRLGGADPL